MDLVHSDELVGQFEHIVSEGDDNELSVFGSSFDVVGNNGYVLVVQSSIDLVHKVKGSRFIIVESENEG